MRSSSGGNAASDRAPRGEATIDWMVDDVAARCRAVLETLATGRPSAVTLGGAAMILGGASDDLAALVELLGGPTATRRDADRGASFGLSFATVLEAEPRM